MSLRSLTADLEGLEYEVAYLQESIEQPIYEGERLVQSIYLGEVDYITPSKLQDALEETQRGYYLENIRVEFEEREVEDYYDGFMETRLYMNVFAEQSESQEGFELRKAESLEKIKVLQDKIADVKIQIKKLVEEF